jgi:hypothetical protein
MGDAIPAASIDPGEVLVNEQSVGPGAVITGTKPPLIPKEWWPLIILVAGGVLLWYLTKGGGRSSGPFA